MNQHRKEFTRTDMKQSMKDLRIRSPKGRAGSNPPSAPTLTLAAQKLLKNLDARCRQYKLPVSQDSQGACSLHETFKKASQAATLR